ncbi:disks large-associated protein 5 isoform 2-T2 [Anableps anableps]
MESRFADLRWRDSSVSMLRVKQSRRRSRSQKENRERMVNTRRQLDKLLEMELSSLDTSMVTTNMSTVQEKIQINAKPAKTAALDRLKRLQSWKEQKELKKEKEKRERESKGVFKTGLYQPKNTFTLVPLPIVPPASSRPKEKKVSTAPSLSTRVTRSMKQLLQEPQKPLAMQHPNTRANKVQFSAEKSTRSRAAPLKPASTATKISAGPGGQALSTRSANRPVRKAEVKDNPMAKDVITTRNRAVVNSLPPSSGGVRNCKAVSTTVQPDEHKKVEVIIPQIQDQEKICSLSPMPCPEDKDMVVNPGQEEAVPAVDFASPSFAPEGFVFQAPAGLSTFKFEPLTPRSADSFLTPSSSFSLPPAPVFSSEPPAEPAQPTPPKTPHCSSIRTSSAFAPSTSGSPQESKHDVPYFRSEISNETARLTNLCLHWETKVEDENIPEEMRDRMRTAIGQARLLMKERFNQFSSLVDACELCRGEKITTCTDLQGFWDMVYFQVEDINKKFDALKEAEGRDWLEEHKPPPRQRKVVKKTSAAPAKPTGNKAAAKSRLAAVKAAMRARQQAAEAERAAKDAENTDNAGSSQEPQVEGQAIVFDGGFFQVESPAKPSIQRSGCLSTAVLPQASPTETLHRTLVQTPGPKSHQGARQASQKKTMNVSLRFSPMKEVFSDETQSDQSPKQPSESVSKQEEATFVPDMGTQMHDPSTMSAEKVDNNPSEVISDVHPLSPRHSLSPCKTPASVHQTPQPASVLSFTLSPCGTPVQPSFSPAEQVPMETQPFVSPTPDGSVIEEIPGLDFERYLQPSQRCSLSPRDTVTIEISSVGADVQMESPKGQAEELLTHLEPALSTASSVFNPQSPQVQTAESALLLFTLDMKDRIRLSTCPSDLMVFTPPSI